MLVPKKYFNIFKQLDPTPIKKNFFSKIFEDVDDFLNDFFDDSKTIFERYFSNDLNSLSDNVYIQENGDLKFEFALPGISKDQIEIKKGKNSLSVNVKRKETKETEENNDGDNKNVTCIKKNFKSQIYENRFNRYSIPEDEYDLDNIQANYKNGLLTIIIPAKNKKEESSDETITIDIKEN